MVLFIVLGSCLVGVAVTLNVGWIILNWRRFVPLLLGIPFFALLIAGVTLNTIFLVREVRRNERHDAFLNAVTHELKTPIASIRLYLETLERREVSPAKRREFYAIMREDSDRLLATVEQVLKAGEVGQRSRKQVRIPVDMRALVAECVEMTRARNHLETSGTEPSAIVFESRDAETPAIVRGSPEELQTVVLNILNNAVKYSPNGVNIRVIVSLEKDAWVMLSVADSGIGIPAAHLKRIFNRFYRVPVRSVLKTKGTGLGLFLVRTIARQHGGDAFAASPGLGKGATVSVQLPRLLHAIPDARDDGRDQEAS
jgi:signal transduction histidine kinase